MNLSVSGLSWPKRKKARQLAVAAARLGVRNEAAIHYTQGPRRWDGIDRGLRAYKGQFPSYADCSSFTTWCLWQGLGHYHCPDYVNGANWSAGYTGTQKTHGKPVKYRVNWRSGDLVHYGAGTGRHVAIYIGRGQVISHGSEGGPMVLPWNYRSDYAETRRYI